MLAVVLGLGLETLGAPTLPTINGDWCADVRETLTIDGSKPQPGHAYRLCVDNTNIRWNQLAADNSTLQIFNGTNVWKLASDESAPGGWHCQTKRTGPESRTFMPYRMTTVDDGTKFNKTETYDGFKNATDLWHFRQGNPPHVPNEFMHWHVAPAVTGQAAQALLATECIQRSGFDRTGPWQHGMRDFHLNYGAFSQPELPAGIKCTQMPPKSIEGWQSENAKFFGDVSDWL